MKVKAVSDVRTKAGPRRFAWIVALSLMVAISGPAVVPEDLANIAAPAAAEVSAATCPFCLNPFKTRDDFCSRCGRLARLTGTSAEHRFWGDAVYVEFARFGDVPKLEATLAADGLVREVVTFGSGDRIEMTKGKKGPVIEGSVGGSAVSKEDAYKATMAEKMDGEGRLLQRSVWAKRNGDPDTYLYRVVDYKYTPDGLLDRIVFVTKGYLGVSDWDKHPAGWIKHSGGEILMVREAGTLRAIETKLRMFKRSLRGEPEPGEEKMMREKVLRSGELVDAVVPAEPAAR